MTRPGDVRFMTRQEINFLKAQWTISAHRMKMRHEHVVPLSRQALQVLQDIWDVSSGDLVLPSIRSWKRPFERERHELGTT
jgi:integrase